LDTLGVMQPTRYSFILRIWFEQEAHFCERQPQLRGSLQQVDFETPHYFHNLNALTKLLENITAWKDDTKDFKGEIDE